MRRLPPLTALRAFEAAARHGNFVKAAAELGVTPGAISQHIKGLEESLGLAQIDSASMAHPTEDHLMPLYVALGAGMSDGGAEKLHSSFTFGSLSMASYGWGM